jgi:hypothetical protein
MSSSDPPTCSCRKSGPVKTQRCAMCPPRVLRCDGCEQPASGRTTPSVATRRVPRLPDRSRR